MQEEFRVGVISSTHGVRGEVKVYPTTDDMKRFKKLKKVRAVKNNVTTELELEQVRFFKNLVIVKFKNYDTIESIESLLKADLFIDRDKALPLEENEYYVADVIGISCFLEDGSPFGKIKDVIQTGANDVFVIERENENDVLVPVIKQCITELNVKEGKVVIKLMDGLL